LILELTPRIRGFIAQHRPIDVNRHQLSIRSRDIARPIREKALRHQPKRIGIARPASIRLNVGCPQRFT
jgi:hypothetical protein